jgi:phosphatidylglycerophosphate synthase
MEKMTQYPSDILLRISALLILLSAALYLVIPTVAPWVMAVSVALFAVRTVASPYPGKSIRGKRLFHFQVFSTVLMIVATYLMFRQRNEWALVMLCGAVFTLYAAVMIPRELEREANNKNDKG